MSPSKFIVQKKHYPDSEADDIGETKETYLFYILSILNVIIGWLSSGFAPVKIENYSREHYSRTWSTRMPSFIQIH